MVHNPKLLSKHQTEQGAKHMVDAQHSYSLRPTNSNYSDLEL